MPDALHLVHIVDENLHPVKELSLYKKLIRRNFYEVIRVLNGNVLFFDDHINRFINSCKLGNTIPKYSVSEIKKQIRKLIEANNFENGNIKFAQIEFEDNTIAFWAYYIPHYYPTNKEFNNGVKTLTYKALRENPNSKIEHSDLKIKFTELIKSTGVFEILLVNNNGYITEGSRSNFFVFKQNRVYTAPVSEILPGITRKYIIQQCNSLGFEIIESSIHLNEIKNYDAWFLSGTSIKILPVNSIDGITISTNYKPLKKLMETFDKFIENQYSEL